MAELSKDLENCVNTCFECVKVCGECEKVCIAGGDKRMAECALACQDCIEACLATISVVARQSDRYATALVFCADLAESCAELCDELEDPVMKRCAQKCRECASQCRKLMRTRVARPTEQPAITAH